MQVQITLPALPALLWKNGLRIFSIPTYVGTKPQKAPRCWLNSTT